MWHTTNQAHQLESRERRGKRSGERQRERILVEEVRRGEDLRGGGRTIEEREVESLIASVMEPCAGIVCRATEEAFTLDLRG